MSNIECNESACDHLVGDFDILVDEQIAEYETLMYEIVMSNNNENNRFINNLESMWWKGFVAYETMYILAVEFATEYDKAVQNNEEDRASYPIKYFALLNIYGRACQQFAEILCLLKNGFVDGAFARWRSLFELSIYAKFISQSNDEVATAYIEQADTDYYKDEWARKADCFQNNSKIKITIKLLMENCGFSQDELWLWKQQYDLASKTVHASPQGTMKRMANPEGDVRNVIPVGTSDWGLHVPAEHAIISFYEVSETYFTVLPNAEGVFARRILERWVEIVRKYLYETVGTCFPEVEEAAKIYKKYIDSCGTQKQSSNSSM